MRIVTAVLGALTAATIFIGWHSVTSTEPPSEERVKTPSMVTARIASTNTAMALDHDWKRRGADAVANFIVENLNTLEVTSFDIVCFLFDKDAKSVGEVKHPVQSKLAANSKSSFAGIFFRNVEPSSRRAICMIDNAQPWVRF